MERAREKFKIGQPVEILVHNSHRGEIGKIVAFNEHNAYNVKVQFDDNVVQGYMVNELKALNKSVEVSQKEYDEVTAVKPMFLISGYQ